jgi:hypothetical protein
MATSKNSTLSFSKFLILWGLLFWKIDFLEDTNSMFNISNITTFYD